MSKMFVIISLCSQEYDLYYLAGIESTTLRFQRFFSPCSREKYPKYFCSLRWIYMNVGGCSVSLRLFAFVAGAEFRNFGANWVKCAQSLG